MTFFYSFVTGFLYLLFKVFFRHKVYGLHNVVENGALICSNHVSYLDPPIIAISWPRQLHFLARKGLFRFRLFAWLIRKLNAHPIEGGESNLKTVKLVSRLLHEGKQVVIFPEGERSWKGEILDMKHGFGMIVMREKVDCIPTYIHGAYDVLPRGKAIPRLFKKTACVFGSPISWNEFADLPKKEAQKALAARVKEEILELKKWYEEGCEGTPP